MTQLVGVVVLACWVAVLAGTVLQGHRTSSYSDLVSAVRSGDATEVQVSPGLPARASGHATVEIRWRDGLLRRTTSVVEVRGRQTGHRSDATTAVLRRPVPDALRARDPDLEITTLRRDGGGFGVSAELLGWTAPAPVALGYLTATLATLLLLALGPEPRRVTPWGWFWLILLTGPIGSIAFLVMSGVLSRTPVAPPMRPRTGGGWAFILALALGSVAGTLNG
ncbi:hypothetical protein GHK92_05450 [Nocardioides sp. dk4132]|uniref:hypothetical protein n=1 Tax=unclassified Nocardioides TaxID=2615069 RepID=UPI0012977C7E|nr:MULTISPECIES: hypothetical protein [unclassified Nocardioides]MQW75313.1 hypothetical protein [Nocardioides sp. dk4132]QGA07537.1 hypothetical protein GFH29_09160 [Nocardioides sp. dk884]